MEQFGSPGDRVRDVRKRRGLTQRALAEKSGVSLSLIKKLEQGDYGEVRLETLHKIAVILRVPTTALAAPPDAALPEREDEAQWVPVRRALAGIAIGEPDEEPTRDGLTDAVDLAVAALLESRYAELRTLLPALLRDADALVGISVNGHRSEGRFLIRVSTAAIRDNRPGEAQDALRLARMAAAGVRKDVIPRFNRWQVFGPMTVAMFQAQNALIQDRPDFALSVEQQFKGRTFPLPETWNRHRLDVAHAHASLRQQGEAVGVLQEVRRAAPEWLAQQRYARDILHKIIGRRRTLTTEMRELADFVSLPL